MVRRYKIFITDGYATSGHAPNGEHPIGLALDIVPNKAAGGSWRKVTRLARWAEPSQNNPRAPFRWVGYKGDSGHGRGDHLHLSWMHSKTPPKTPAEIVYTRFCPDGSSNEPPLPPAAARPDPAKPAVRGAELRRADGARARRVAVDGRRNAPRAQISRKK